MAELGWASEAKVERAQSVQAPLAPDVGIVDEEVEPFFVYYIRNLILDNETGEFDAFGRTGPAGAHAVQVA